MTFDEIAENKHLWAARFENEEENELYKLFDNWLDVNYLRSFFKENIADLSKFKFTIDAAIEDTLDDADILNDMLLDETKNIESLFQPLSPNTRLYYLEKKKTKGLRINGHDSWLRIYAIKVDVNLFIITGGAIKLTRTMQERKHTNEEFKKLERVRTYLCELGVIDSDSFIESCNEEES